VTELSFLNKGLSQNSVAFWAKLADGRSGVFRADQDEPSQSPLSLDPLYEEIGQYTTTISAERSDGTVADGDSADIYFPKLPHAYCNSTEFPIALLLQGALVDKADYSNFAKQVASYGFVVVVPNNERTLSRPDGSSATGLFPEQGQVNDVLDQMKVEDQDADSEIFKIVDTTKLGLLGHSFGGAVGIGATQEEIRIPGLSAEDYTVPSELKAGIFYGTSFGNPETGEFVPINNKVPLGLIRGDLDGVSLPDRSQSTYDEILNPPKVLVTVKGANHYGITNEDNAVRDPSRPTLDQASATSAIAQSSGLFLRATLLNDHSAFDAVFNTSTPFNENVSIMSQAQPMFL
jgi:dienelactone hydrolase